MGVFFSMIHPRWVLRIGVTPHAMGRVGLAPTSSYGGGGSGSGLTIFCGVV